MTNFSHASTADMPDVLKRILEVKVRENAARSSTTPIASLQARINEQTPVRGFVNAK